MSANVFMCDRTGLVQCICVVSIAFYCFQCFLLPFRSAFLIVNCPFTIVHSTWPRQNAVKRDTMCSGGISTMYLCGFYAFGLTFLILCPRRTGLTFLSWYKKVSKKDQGCQKKASSSSQSPSAAGWSSPIRSKLPGLTKWLFWLRLSFFEGRSRIRSIQTFNRPYSFAEK